MIVLAIDASTYRGSVAVIRDRTVLAESEVAMRGRDEERLMPAVADVLGRARVKLPDIDHLVCGSGPGSFTSLRIAASLAKGMAIGANKPLYAVSSLALIIAGNVPEAAAPRRFAAALDAMRDEYFVAVFEHKAGALSAIGSTRLVPKADVEVVAAAEKAVVVGPDFGERWAPRARGVAMLDAEIRSAGPVNLADWEPTYGRLAEAQAKWEATHGALPR